MPLKLLGSSQETQNTQTHRSADVLPRASDSGIRGFGFPSLGRDGDTTDPPEVTNEAPV